MLNHRPSLRKKEKQRRREGTDRKHRSRLATLILEQLESRLAPAFTGLFNAATGALTVTGTNGADAGVLSVGAGQAILLDGAAIPGGPNLRNTRSIQMLGLGDNDVLD